MTEKEAIMTVLMRKIDHANRGMMGADILSLLSYYHSAENMLFRNGIRIKDNRVYKNGKALFAIRRKYAKRKVDGCYAELKPKLVKIANEV